MKDRNKLILQKNPKKDISSNMPKTKHNNDRSVSRHGTGQKAAKKGGGGGSELIMS